MGQRPTIHIPTLEEQAQTVWECQALVMCGEPDEAKRLTAAKYWVETRRAVGLNNRAFPPPSWPRPEDKYDG